MTTSTNAKPEVDSRQYKVFLDEIKQFIPSDRIYTDELRTLGWGTDASFYRQIPKAVIRSDGEEEVSKIIRACNKYKLPFTFRAAGTSLSGQSISDSILIVAGKHWEKYEIGPSQDTIRMQPGIVGSRVNEILKPYGRVFPPDPASIGSAMVGGIVCNNASGMNCGVHANSDRMMVSARLILTDGTVVDTGDEQSKAAFRKNRPQIVLRHVIPLPRKCKRAAARRKAVRNIQRCIFIVRTGACDRDILRKPAVLAEHRHGFIPRDRHQHGDSPDGPGILKQDGIPPPVRGVDKASLRDSLTAITAVIPEHVAAPVGSVDRFRGKYSLSATPVLLRPVNQREDVPPVDFIKM